MAWLQRGLLLALLAGCSAHDGVPECIDAYPAETPLDVGDAAAVTAAGGTQTVPASAARIAGLCRQSGGFRCDPDEFISKGAAACIGDLAGLDSDDRPWTIALSYSPSYSRVVWTITTTPPARGSDAYLSEFLTVDATDGVVLEHIESHVIP
jgi:hypothetical protein